MPRIDDRAADSLAPEPLRRADPPHGTLAVEPSMLSAARSGMTTKAGVRAGGSSSPSPSALRSPPLARPSESVGHWDDWDDSAEADFAAGETLLRLHAAELIERLQRWSCDLDARQSQLNLQSASQDHRERQFRMWTQAREMDLQERIQIAEQRDKELRDSARRLALAELGNQH